MATKITRASIATATAIVFAWAGVGAASASSRPAASPANAAAKAAAVKAVAARAALRGIHIGAPRVPPAAGRTGRLMETDSIPVGDSANWSGYTDTTYGSTFYRNVAATWHVPEITSGDCTHGTFATGAGLASFWVGLDGANDSTVEQAGTLSECYEGTPYYFDWYEMYPQGTVTVNAVNPGDEISAYVDYTGGYWLLAVVDDTNRSDSFETIQSCPAGSSCELHSAEVVAEAPSGCAPSSGQTCREQDGYSFYLMPNFDYVQFYGISDATKTAGGSLASTKFGPTNNTMTNSAGTVLAKVSSLWSQDAFNDSWEASG